MWIDALKQHVLDEVAYSPTHKALYVGLIDEACKDSNPEAVLSKLVLLINDAGTMRSAPLAEFVSRCLYQFREEAKALPADGQAARLILLDKIIQGKGE